MAGPAERAALILVRHAAGLQPQALWRSLRLPEALVLDGSGQLIDRIG